MQMNRFSAIPKRSILFCFLLLAFGCRITCGAAPNDGNTGLQRHNSAKHKESVWQDDAVGIPVKEEGALVVELQPLIRATTLEAQDDSVRAGPCASSEDDNVTL